MDTPALYSRPKQLTVAATMADTGGRSVPPSPVEPTFKRISPREVRTLTEAWKEAKTRFIQITEQTLHENAVDIEKFTQSWAERSDKELHDQKTTKKHRMLNIFNNIVDGLCLLGDLVASGAQVVFGFAGPCINALSFLLQIPQRISDVYDTVLNVYEEVESFLVRFKILNRIDRGKGLPTDMIRYACDMLITFIDISALVYKILKQTKRTMLAAAFLRSDRGISDALAGFRGMAQKLDGLIHTVNLEGIYDVRELSKETNVGVKAILKSMEQTSSSEKTKGINQTRLATISQNIYAEGERAIAEKSLDLPDLLPQTLDCLTNDEKFCHWRDDPVESNRAQFLLSGPSKSGKSYLMKALQTSLLQRRGIAEEADVSIYVAYHDFASGSSKNSSLRIPFALRNMARQVAEQSLTYAPVLEKELKSKVASLKSYNVQELWRSLKLATFEQKTQEAKMYLLFDGIEVETQANVEELIYLLARNRSDSQGSNDTLSIRAIFTVDPEKQQINLPLPTIDTEQATRQLVRPYTIRELKKRDLFQSPDAKSSRNREKIMQAANGMTFRQIEQKLEMIQHEYHNNLTSKPMDEILQDETGQLLNHGTRVPSLNLKRKLSTHEVSEINHLLPWLLFSEYATCLEMEELEAVLCLAHGGDSLQSLHTKIDGAYCELLYLDRSSNFVRLRSDKESVLLKVAEQTLTTMHGENTLINLNISIENAGKSVVQQFLWQLRDNLDTNRFEFESFSKMNQDVVPMDETQSHLYIAQMCMKLLNDGWDDGTQILVRYAREFLPRHFVHLASRLDVISITDQTSISRDLVHFLRTPYQLSRDDDHGFGSGTEWLSNTEAVQSIRKWLLMTRDRLDTRQRKWVDESLKPNKGSLGHMYNVARAVGKKWLRHHKETAKERWPSYGIRTTNALEVHLFNWLNLYIENNKPERPNVSLKESVDSEPALDQNPSKLLADNNEVEIPRDEGGDDQSSPNHDRPRLIRVDTVKELSYSERIKRAIAWVQDQEVAYVTRGTANINIGYTFLSVDDYDEAEKHFKRAMEKSSHERQGLMGLGRLNYAKDDKEEAASCLQRALAIFEDQASHEVDENDSTQILSELLCELATVYEQLQRNLQDIIPLYEKSLDHVDNLDNRWKLLQLLCRDGAAASIEKAQNCFKTWLTSTDEDGEKMIIRVLRRTASENPDCRQLELFVNELRDETLRSDIITAFRNFTTTEDRMLDPRTKSKFLYLQGLATVKGTDDNRWTAAVELWEEVIRSQDVRADAYWSYQDFAVKASHVVARYYFDAAISKVANNGQRALADDDKEKIFQRLVHDLHDKVFNGSTSPPLWVKDIVKRCLVSMNVILGREDDARRSTEDDMATVIDILQDDDIENDYEGVTNLMSMMCSIGDKVGVLTAFSLYDREASSPTDDMDEDAREPQSLEIKVSAYRKCDGCSKDIRSSNEEGWWLCQSCYDLDLCVTCYNQMMNNAVTLPRCGSSHNHIRVYHVEYDKTEKSGNMVLVDWEWIDQGNGKFNRKGGRLVPLSEWLATLRVKWNITETSGDNKAQR